jgi:hypothetical protein
MAMKRMDKWDILEFFISTILTTGFVAASLVAAFLLPEDLMILDRCLAYAGIALTFAMAGFFIWRALDALHFFDYPG